jgi:hypothetical protein
MSAKRPARLLAALLVLALLPCPSCQRAPRFDHDFEQEGALDEFAWQCRTLYRLSGEHAASGSRSLEITMHPAPEGTGENYPGLSFSKFDPDWSAFRSLAFDAYNPGETPLGLALRIDDREDPDYADRFNRSVALAPGPNRISIPFAELVASGTKRALDLRRVRTVALFVANPKERRTLYLDRVRLE